MHFAEQVLAYSIFGCNKLSQNCTIAQQDTTTILSEIHNTQSWNVLAFNWNVFSIVDIFSVNSNE